MNDLAVVTVVENPLGWKSRYKNYAAFAYSMILAGAKLYTVEIVSKGAPFKVTRPGYPRHLQLTTDSEIWHKENALNLLIERVDEENIVWADSDILVTSPTWVEDTIDQLQKYKIVQPFSHVQYLGYSNQPLGCARPGYLYQYKTDGAIYGGVNFWGNKPKNIPREKNANPGLCCAASKQTWKNLGGLIDWCIAGSGDFHMMAAYLGQLNKVIEKEGGYTRSYISKCWGWQNKCDEYIGGSVSYVPGLICHYWHGAHAKRKHHYDFEADTEKDFPVYKNIMRDALYDPDVDIEKDEHGLYRLTGRNNKLRDAIKDNLHNRNEDEKGEVLTP